MMRRMMMMMSTSDQAFTEAARAPALLSGQFSLHQQPACSVRLMIR